LPVTTTPAITPCPGLSLIAGINATGDIFLPMSLTTAMKQMQQNFLIYHRSRISLYIFVKILNGSKY
jgi:hypothetical protein